MVCSAYFHAQYLIQFTCCPCADELRQAAPGGPGGRAVRRRRSQYPRRVPHQRPQPLGGVRERDEGPGGARSQRDGDHVVPAENAGGQLHGHRRVGYVSARDEHGGHRFGAQVPGQRVRQPMVHRRPSDDHLSETPKAATGASVAPQRHQVRRGQCCFIVFHSDVVPFFLLKKS